MGSNDPKLINDVISSFTRDNESLLNQLWEIGYWNRGWLSRDDVFALSPYEREKAIEKLNKRFEDAGKLIKNQVPVFL